MSWKGIIPGWLLLAAAVLIDHHADPVGTDIGLMVLVPIVGGITLWQLLKYGRMSPELRAEMRARALARRDARSR